MSTLWYTILGLLFMAYFALGGLDQGVAMLLPLHRGEQDRRIALNALGPMFLGNEVWIVGAVGVLIAAFPRLEGELFAAAYPVVVGLVLALLALSAGVQLRSRGTRRGLFDPLIAGSGLVLAAGWGLLLGILLHGVPLRADGHVDGFAPLLSPAVWLTAAAHVLLVVVHGTAYLSWRTGHRRTARLRSRIAPVAAALILALPAVWSAQRPPDVRNPWTGIAVATVVAVLVAAAGVLRGRAAFTATLVACALPVVAVALARYPGVLASTVDPGATVTVDSAAAGSDTLRLLAIGAAPLLPVLAAVQLSCWWLFRRRDRQPTVLYW